MAEESKDQNPPKEPPKLDLKARGILKGVGAEAVADSQGADGNSEKKKTSRISLEPEVGAEQPVSGIKPPSTIKISRPGQTAQIQSGPVSDESSAEAKKKTTSRISLESAMSTPVEPAGGAPKTIRLKRPTASSGPRVSPDATTIRVRRGADEEEPPAESQPVAGDEAPPSPTQRKTVVIKRSGEDAGPSTGGGKKLKIAKPSSGSAVATPVATVAAPVAGVPTPMVVKPFVDKVSWVYVVYAIAAIIICMVGIYVFTAQSIGPNISLTQYSYAPTSSRLPWPGRITREILNVSQERWLASRDELRSATDDAARVLAPEATPKSAPVMPVDSMMEDVPPMDDAGPVDMIGGDDDFGDDELL